jgi:hypothetical protein
VEPQTSMPRAERERLREFYRPYNAALSEQLADLGMRLPVSWYDALPSQRSGDR